VSGATGQLGDHDRGESGVSQGDALTSDLGAIDKGPLVVNDLDNSSELAGVLALVDKDDTANLDESPVDALHNSLGRHFSV